MAFCFCVEPGRLESEALPLVESIRRYGGRFADAPIHAVQPRRQEALRPETLALFRRRGVTLHAERLNTRFESEPTLNKVFAVAWLEDRVNADTLVFLDTDSVVVNEPALLALEGEAAMAVQPTVRKFLGSAGPGDPREAWWQAAYRTCGVDEPPFVRAIAARTRMRGYYNAGLVALRCGAGLGALWLDHLHRLDPLTSAARHNLDQFALATVAASVAGRVELLPFAYNYSLERRAEYVGPARLAQLSELVHIHYHAGLRHPDFLVRLRPRLVQEDERVRWLAGFVPLEPRGGRWRPRSSLRRRIMAGLFSEAWKLQTALRGDPPDEAGRKAQSVGSPLPRYRQQD